MSAHAEASAVGRAHAELMATLDRLVQVLHVHDDTEALEVAERARVTARTWRQASGGELLDLWEL